MKPEKLLAIIVAQIEPNAAEYGPEVAALCFASNVVGIHANALTQALNLSDEMSEKYLAASSLIFSKLLAALTESGVDADKASNLAIADIATIKAMMKA